MNRSLLALALAALSAACVPTKEEPPVIPPVTVQGRTCDISSWSPYTLESDVETRVVIKARCEGGELAKVSSTEELSLDLPDGTTLKLTADVTLRQGDESEFAFTLPAIPFQAGLLKVGPGRAGQGASAVYALAEGTRSPLFRLRKRPELLYQEWDDVIDQHLTEIQSNPLNVDSDGTEFNPLFNPLFRMVSDLNGDDALDVLQVERDGANLRVSTFLGPTLALTKETVLSDAALDVKDPAESIRFGRAKGGTSDRAGALYWNAVDATAQEGRLAVIPVADGVASSAKTFKTSSFFVGRVAHMVQDSFAYRSSGGPSGTTDELAFLYRGETGGKPHFGFVVTDVANGKLIPLATLDTLAGVTPADVESGAVKVGLLCDPKAPATPRAACNVDALTAWTLGKTGAAGEVELRRISLSGAEAGLVQSGAKVTGFDPAETHVQAESLDADGDGFGDVVLTSLAGGDQPRLRLWPSTNGVALSGAQFDRTFGGGMQVSGLSWQGKGKRLYNSVQHPYILKTGPTPQAPPKHLIGGQFSARLDGLAGSLPVELTWDATASGSEKPYSLSPITLGVRAELSKLPADASVVSSVLPSGAFNIHVRSPDDEVVLAGHPSGVTVSFKGIGGGSLLITDSSTLSIERGSIPMSGNSNFNMTSSPLIIQNAAVADEHLVVLRDEQPGKDSQWLVYMSNKEGLSGPATLTIPEKFGRFLPLSATGNSFTVSSADSGTFATLDWTFSAVSSAAKAKGTLAVGDGDVKAHFGVSSVSSISIRSRPIGPPRLSMLCGGKRVLVGSQVAFSVDAGGAVDGTTGTVALVGNDKTSGCPLSTVYFPGDFAKTTPVVLSTSDDEDCDGLWQPAVTADLLGEGTSQVVLAKPQNFGGGLTQWTFVALTHDSAGMRATVLGALPFATGITPTVSSADLDGDSLADVVVSARYQPSHVLFSDGLGGSREGAVKVGAFSELVRQLPGAAPGGQGTQVACGQGLLCGNGSGTKNAHTTVSARPELL